MTSQDLSPEEENELLSFLAKNSDVFTWKTSDLTGVSRNIIEHKLQVKLSVKPRKQKLRKISDEKVEAAKVEVQRFLNADFIRDVQYPNRLANVVMVKKQNVK
jgi:hypothetical protein